MSAPFPPSRSTRPARRGSAYLLVLGASLLLVTAGMGAIYASGVRRSSGELRVDAYRARLAAEAGIEAALDTMVTDPNWRTTQPNGVWFNKRPSGDALGSTFTLTGVDPIDANLANSASDPVEFVAEGLSGRGRYKLRVQVGSLPKPLSCLGVALCSGGQQTHSLVTITSDQTIASNVGVGAILASVGGRVEAVTTITGGSYTGTKAELQPARTLPGAGAFSTYVTAGTSIAWSAIPTGGFGRKTIQRIVASPTSGPLGASPNAMGIYVIDCGGADLDILDSRIVGTLVLLNAGPGTSVKGSMNWTAAVPGYPILMVQGALTITCGSAALSEATTTTNFNPAGTPYLGVSDSDTSDTYPSELRGLIYASGNAGTGMAPRIIGNLICGGTFGTSGQLNLTYDPASFNAPPPGFAQPAAMKIVAGSWQQMVD